MNFRFFALCLLAVLATSRPISQYPNFRTQSGLAFALSGAGGRLSQQNALSQTLINGTYPGGTKLIPSYLAGVSSGALSAVGLNGALENLASNGTAGWTFGQWNQYVFDLENSDIYKSGVRGTIDALTNLDDGYVLNNDALVNTINRALSAIGYSVLGDLFLPTYITVVDLRTGFNLRLLSTDPTVSNLPLIEVLMATTAIPVAFQPRYIPSLTNNTVFVDGGTGIDYIPAIPLLNGALPVETIYALVPNKDTDNGSNGDNSDIEQNSIIRNTLKTFEILGNNLMQGDLAILANANATSFLYSAILNRTFSTLEFGETELQYTLTRNWATNNNPQRITAEGSTAFDRNLPQYYKEGSPLVFGTLSLNNSAIGWSANLAIVVLCAAFALF